jgi:hypothetical protein
MKPSWRPFPKMKEKEEQGGHGVALFRQQRRGVKAQLNSFLQQYRGFELNGADVSVPTGNKGNGMT